jgi:NO-binding membrane sensor protein with MHYT domain
MPAMEQFAYGPVNPILAFLMSLVGAIFGLACTARARRSIGVRDRVRWLIMGSVAIGGVGIWLMHFIAMTGFDVPSMQIRYNIPVTALSLVIAIAVVAGGLFLVGFSRPSLPRILLGGPLVGIGVAAMHYTGMAAMRFNGTVSYNSRLFIASVLIAVVAATVALWFTVATRGALSIGVASVIFALAVCTMHYTGMAALQVHSTGTERVPAGVNPVSMLVPIIVIAILALLAMLFAGLGMMSDGDTALTVDRRLLDAAEPATAFAGGSGDRSPAAQAGNGRRRARDIAAERPGPDYRG